MRPEPGQHWRDGVDHGFVWRIDSVDDLGIVHLTLLKDGVEATTREWPANRWSNFVDRQKASLMKRDDAT